MKHFTRSVVNKRIIDYKTMSCVSDIVEYDKTSSVNAVELIRQVKNYPQLYDSQSNGYQDFPSKELVWDNINETLFPGYRFFPDSIQSIIKQTVRRRWKSLRNLMAKDIRTKITKKNYQPNMNPLLKEMEFLLPHIKSIYAKVAQEKKQTSSNMKRHFAEENTMFQDIANATSEEDETSSMMTIDQKPYQKSNQTHYFNRNTDPDSSANNFYQDTVSASNNENCVNEGEFNPNLSYLGIIREQPQSSTISSQNLEERRKRQSEDNSEIQEKLFEYLSTTFFNRDNVNETEDEERMFMLSLVSDLKSLPSAKKMLVKAEIVTAIARATQ